jgi:ligand-binding sensor domain-containing protein
MNKIKLALLPIFLVSFFVSNSIDTGVTVTQLDKTIWTIYQDKKSNYWFGSKENGVYYYNGQQLKHITTENGLVSNEIRGIQEDANGNIFFDTEKGVSKFDGQTFKTLQMANPASPINNWVLKPDDLWFRMGSTKSGAYRFDGKYLHYLKFPTSPQENMFYMKNPNTSLKPYGLYTIYKDRKGYMWFGTASLGVCRYDGRTLNWHYEEQLQTTPNGGDFGTRAIFEDKNGKFWINNTRFRYVIETFGYKSVTFKKESGVGYLNKTNKMEFPYFLSITEDNKGNLWMATYEDGVWKYNGKELIHYPVKDGETNVLLFTIYKDNKGVLWLGTHNAGVYTFNGHSFEKFVQ